MTEKMSRGYGKGTARNGVMCSNFGEMCNVEKRAVRGKRRACVRTRVCCAACVVGYAASFRVGWVALTKS